MLAAENDRREAAHVGRAWLAWHAAYLPWSKKPVDLKKLIGAAAPQPDIGGALHSHLMSVSKTLQRKEQEHG